MKFIYFLLMTFLTLSAAEMTDPATSQSFPDSVSFEVDGKNVELQATGVATRKKFFVKVYSAAFYLQDAESFKGADPFSAILASNKAKQLTMKWVHEADLQKIQDGYRESIKGSLGAQYDTLKTEVEQFLKLYTGGAKVGDEHILRFFPNGTVEVLINGTSAGKVTNSELAKGVLNIWLGDKSVVKRDELVSLIK